MGVQRFYTLSYAVSRAPQWAIISLALGLAPHETLGISLYSLQFSLSLFPPSILQPGRRLPLRLFEDDIQGRTQGEAFVEFLLSPIQSNDLVGLINSIVGRIFEP